MKRIYALHLFLICLLIILIIPLSSAKVLVEEKQIFTAGTTGMIQQDACKVNEKRCEGLKLYYCSAGSWRIEDKCSFDEACVIQFNGCVKKLDLPKMMDESNLVYDENGTIVEGNDNKPLLIGNESDVDVVDTNAPMLIPYEESDANIEGIGEEENVNGFEEYLIQEEEKEKIIKKDVSSGFDFRFISKEDVHRENGELFILKGDMKYYVKFTPEDVIGKLFPDKDIVLKSLELLLYQDKAAFKIEQKVRGKFLGLIPANTKVTYYVNSENNEVMRKAKPWYMKVE